MSQSTAPRLWITYAWKDNQEGNFDYLVQELTRVGVTATYDRVELVPGLPLWEQIGAKITSEGLDGWASLITPNSLASQPCREELRYALDRALRTKGEAFPLIGLVTDGVPMAEVPISLRVRLCVNLADQNWRESVRAGLEHRAPNPTAAPSTRHIWTVWPNFAGVSTRLAIEVRPRFGQIPFWRFIIPFSTSVHGFGRGATGGRWRPSLMLQAAEDDGTTGVIINGQPCKWLGTGDPLSPELSAYVVIDGPAPEFAGFGPAGGPDDLPDLAAVEVLPIAELLGR